VIETLRLQRVNPTGNRAGRHFLQPDDVRVSVSNSSSLGGDWKLDKVAAIGDPPHPA
jgi:hypothetical protein